MYANKYASQLTVFMPQTQKCDIIKLFVQAADTRALPKAPGSWGTSIHPSK